MRVLPLVLATLTSVSLALPTVGEAPPQQTTAQLESAFHALDAERFAGTFTVTTVSLVSKVSGEDREEGKEVWRITVLPGEEPAQELVSAQEKGVDVTAERRQKHEKERPKEEKKPSDRDDEEGGTLSASLRLPMGDDLALYSFGTPVSDGELQVATFTPRAEHRKKEGMALGRLAWRTDTAEPVWIEAQPTDLPRGAKELSLRFELARAGDVTYIGRTVTDGVGGILWIKRRFHAEVEIGDVTPAQSE